MCLDTILYSKYKAAIKSNLVSKEDKEIVYSIEKALGLETEQSISEFRKKLIESDFDWRSNRQLNYAIQQIVGGF